MSLGQILRKRREELHYTLDEVAAKTGFSKPYLSTIETGRVRNPPSDILLRRLETALGFETGLLLNIGHLERMPADIRENYEKADAQNRRLRQILQDVIQKNTDVSQLSNILSEEDLNTQPVEHEVKAGMLVPVINRVAAGYPVDFDDLGYPVGYADDYVRCPGIHDPNAFAVRVVGDSMEPKFREGEIVIFSPSTDVRNGDDCFIRFSHPHETTFKRVFFEADGRLRLQPRNQNYAPTIIEGDRISGMYRAVIRYENL
ncbi:MAG: helix-turn-helix domain-containing protein [Phycisphaerae bacterium]|nr:helix-turn-helix domain-containing protein [Phycisphaerae bacterium]